MSNELAIFQPFAKGSKKVKPVLTDCIIYTRVSDYKQEEGTSLETQIQDTRGHAQRNKLNIREEFGGTSESASSDERKEFQRMMAYLRKAKPRIGCVLVYSLERFSRNDNAIGQLQELRAMGIEVVSVTQPIDTSNPTGQMQQKITMIFGEHENQLRRQKCMAGIKARLLQGQWCTKPPLGYDIVRADRERKIVLNATGKLLRKAFLWKAQEGLSNEDIRKNLAALGLKLCHQRISEIFRNPFYCGLLVHSVLEGQVVEGKQELLVSKEIFLKVNGLLDHNAHGYKISREQDQLPLKHFLRCADCGNFLRGYGVKRQQKSSGKGYYERKEPIYYYKCTNKGCRNNISAKDWNARFESALHFFHLDMGPEMEEIIRGELEAFYEVEHKNQQEEKVQLEKQLHEVNHKLGRLEERYILEEIGKDLFDKYRVKFSKEREEISERLMSCGLQKSNLLKGIDKAVSLSRDLASLWASSNYSYKHRLQFAIFPDGIRYSRQNNENLMPDVNPIFAGVARLAQERRNEKSGIPMLNLDYAALVELTGEESNFLEGLKAVSY